MATYYAALGSQYQLELTVNQTSQNQGANTSTVSWLLQIRRLSGTGRWSFDANAWSVNIGGNAASGSTTYDFRDYSLLTLGSGSYVIAHDSSGYKTIAVSGSWPDTAVNLGSGTASGNLTLTRIPKAPGTPGTPTAGTTTSTSVALSWSAPADNGGSAITGYEVQYATDASFTTGVGTQSFSGTSGTVTSLAPGFTYYFRVRAINAVGTSDPSGVVSRVVGLPAPTLTGWSQNSTGDLVATWTAPAVTTGLTGYRVQVARDAGFTTGVTNHNLGNVLTHAVSGLAGGRVYHVRVAALTAGGVNTYSGSMSTMLVLDAGDLDGWSRVGTQPAEVAYYTAEGIRRGTTGSKQALWLESIATAAVTLNASTYGMQKTVTGLVIGQAYRFQGRATIEGDPLGTTYQLVVIAEDDATPVSVTTNTDLGFVEFVADATTVVLRIMLAETVVVAAATDEVERVAFHDLTLLELGTDYPVRLRETVYESNLANHFDLACNSVGATWFVGPDGITRFRLPGTALPVSAAFTDETRDDALHYVDVSAAYDTRGMFNRLDVTNYGVDEERENEANDDLIRTSDDSIAAYGVRSARLETNLWDAAPYDETLEGRLSELLDEGDEPRLLVSALRWNAQESLAMAPVLDVGQRISVRFNGVEQDSQIVALQHDITPTRWVTTIEVRKVGA